VAPLTPGAGIDRKFGEKVAEEVRKRLDDLDATKPLKKDEVNDALKRFGLDNQILAPIQWTAIAANLHANLVMVGNADATDSGVQVKAMFIQAESGEELPIPDFTVLDDGGSSAKEASGRIIEAFDAQVAYLKSLHFCQEYLAAIQFDDALRNCNEALEMKPSATQALYYHGRTLMGLERFEEAVPDLEKVLEADPAKEEAIQSLAYSYVQLGSADRATVLYRQYLELHPEERLPIAHTLYEAGNVDAALEIVRDGLELDPTNQLLSEYLESPELRDRPSFVPYDVAPKLKNAKEIQRLLQRLYPAQLREAGVEGTVVLWIYIDENGKVPKLQVQKSSGYNAMDKAAMSTASQMEFEPAMHVGIPTPVWVAQALTFEVR
jgi:TonB family protein